MSISDHDDDPVCGEHFDQDAEGYTEDGVTVWRCSHCGAEWWEDNDVDQ